jgi:hypothetical protein
LNAQDAGHFDAGPSDAKFSDAGLSDAGLFDGGLSDRGFSDGGLSDGGLADAGHSDAGGILTVVGNTNPFGGAATLGPVNGQAVTGAISSNTTTLCAGGYCVVGGLTR